MMYGELERLMKRSSVKAFDCMTALWPDGTYSMIEFDFDPKLYNYTYAVTNGVIMYILDDDINITINTPNARRLIIDSGAFMQKNFKVPFTNGEIPMSCSEKWKKCVNINEKLLI